MKTDLAQGLVGHALLLATLCAGTAAQGGPGPIGPVFVERSAIPQRVDSFAEALVDVDGELRRRGMDGELELASVRVFEVDADGNVAGDALPVRLTPDRGAAGARRVVWRVPGDGLIPRNMTLDQDDFVVARTSGARLHPFRVTYRIHFGMQPGAGPAPLAPELPARGELIPNGGFERVRPDGEASADHPGFNPLTNALDSQVVHAGRYSLRLSHAEGQRYTSFGIPDLRVNAGGEYVVSCWGRAQGTDANVAYNATVMWFDRDYKILRAPEGHTVRDSVIASRYKRSDFDWEYFENTVKAPEEAWFASVSVSTWSEVGSIWLDELSFRPLVLPDDPLAAERVRLTATSYPDLDLLHDVSPQVVTPHVPWARPDASGQIRVLYMAHVRKDTDGALRHVVEFAQRADLDWTFMPVLKRKLRGGSVYKPDFADELEPYSIELLKQHLRHDRFDAVVVDGLDFKGIQEAFPSLLRSAAAAGSGLMLFGCRNVPDALVVPAEARESVPAHFAMIPCLNDRLPVARGLRACLRMGARAEDRVVAVDPASRLYPCVPPGTSFYVIDTAAWAFPAWEYQYLLWTKVLRWAARRAPQPSVTGADLESDRLVFELSGPPGAGDTLEVALRNARGGRGSPVRVQCPRPGANRVVVALPALPAGRHVAEYRLLDAAGKVRDFGATAFDVRAACRIASLSTDRLVSRRGEPVTLRAELTGVPADAHLTAEIWDTYDRLVWQGAAELSAGQGSVELRAELVDRRSIVHRGLARVVQDDRVLCDAFTEFSTPDSFPPDDEFCVYLWWGGPIREPDYLRVLKQTGFDSTILPTSRTDYLAPALVHANLRPWGYALGMPRLGHKGEHSYRGEDKVREPCFSAPDWWRERQADADRIAPKLLYYGVRDCIITDELLLGPNVCFSDHTLRDFRTHLRQSVYPDLAALNTEWASAFGSWDEVTPRTLEETRAGGHPRASWLDHKMFMTRVFAGLIERTRALFAPTFPEIKVGLSGTQNPGYTYNWWEFLKVAECIGNYGGIQNDLIRSFRQPGARIGRWTGGYARPWMDAEKYERNQCWEQLLNGSACHFFFHGSSCWGMRGDLRPNRNTTTTFEEIELIRSGIDKLLLSAAPHDDGIAVHYSPASFFAAEATLGRRPWEQALNAWKVLVDDLGLSFRFVAGEQLEQGELTPARHKVLILPVSLCLSRRETEAIERFVRAGGTVVADYGAGRFNEHGNPTRNAKLLDLFGLDRDAHDARFTAGELEVGDAPHFGSRARTLAMRCAGEQLRPTTGSACARFGDRPALVVKSHGRGKAVFLNCVMHDYAKTDLAGGGEDELLGRGDPRLTLPVRELVRDLFAGVGIRPQIAVMNQAGADVQTGLRTVVYEAGPHRYVGLLKPDMSVEPIRSEERLPVTIDFGTTAHVYDVRAGTYLGHTRRIPATIAPATGLVYALLPYRVGRVNVRGQSTVRGEDAVMSLSLDAVDAEPADHVLTVRFISPSGRELDLYRTKVRVHNGAGTLTLRTALNDPAGKWTVRATDVATGTTGTGTLDLR